MVCILSTWQNYIFSESYIIIGNSVFERKIIELDSLQYFRKRPIIKYANVLALKSCDTSTWNVVEFVSLLLVTKMSV